MIADGAVNQRYMGYVRMGVVEVRGIIEGGGG